MTRSELSSSLTGTGVDYIIPRLTQSVVCHTYVLQYLLQTPRPIPTSPFAENVRTTTPLPHVFTWDETLRVPLSDTLPPPRDSLSVMSGIYSHRLTSPVGGVKETLVSRRNP